MKQLFEAVIKVMQEVDGIEKGATVGKGNNAYKGVSDKDVKRAYKEAMSRNGLVILPIDIEENVRVDRWESEEVWNGQKQIKQKQQIMVEVKTKYLLGHISGESIELKGYGHGIDTQDKAAGKATTYALKNCLLYSFLNPTGDIDDTDTIHSDDIVVLKTNAKVEKEWLNQGTEQWKEAVKFIVGGGTISKIKSKYRISKQNEQELMNQSL